jgi:carbohydrate-selective porin OprB
VAVDLSFSPSAIKIIKSREMRWAGHVARMGRGGTGIGYWRESQRESDNYNDLDISGSTIPGCMFKQYIGVVWAGLIWLRIENSRGPL